MINDNVAFLSHTIVVGCWTLLFAVAFMFHFVSGAATKQTANQPSNQSTNQKQTTQNKQTQNKQANKSIQTNKKTIETKLNSQTN